MLPRWHIFFGAIFTLLILLLVPQISFLYLILVFLSSIFIDFDHYVICFLKTKKWKIGDVFEYHRKQGIQERKEIAKGVRKKSDFHLFHTVEFHFLIGLSSIFWTGFFYIFLGMMFHSLLDVSDLLNRGSFHRREYFFFNWVRRK